ncbi:unnamed protein product [Caretta caretta]
MRKFPFFNLIVPIDLLWGFAGREHHEMQSLGVRQNETGARSCDMLGSVEWSCLGLTLRERTRESQQVATGLHAGAV